ncbi:hypothetical protein PspS35_09760 [Pseudomonas sp. S35]|jgi:hypothetical protein|uniref:DUF6190 family protein n=1 Tax=Pseudomonas sp. S35 TaxID=1573719 RepID=UPI00132EA090|nr:DUF6190 family protein [Pseudomonas sp. S35]QHF44070.1 hypothetical protein PspS35_09760 [Pseudomonas sp. S35]
MTDSPLFIDASFFLGMHDSDELRRRRSLTYFTRHLAARPRMNYEQIGICDAVIWLQSREAQDLYYPFMDRLHSDMAIQREGYRYDEIQLALSHRELNALAPEQALLVAQVLQSQGWLATHDPVLAALQCLQGRLWQAGDTLQQPHFPDGLQTLYEASRAFTYTGRQAGI